MHILECSTTYVIIDSYQSPKSQPSAFVIVKSSFQFGAIISGKCSIPHEDFDIGVALGSGEFYPSNRRYSERSLENTSLNPVSISIIFRSYIPFSYINPGAAQSVLVLNIYLTFTVQSQLHHLSLQSIVIVRVCPPTHKVATLSNPQGLLQLPLSLVTYSVNQKDKVCQNLSNLFPKSGKFGQSIYPL